MAEEEAEAKRPTGPVTVKLRTPITIGNSSTISEITFRPAKGKDFRGLKFSKEYAFDALLDLAGRLSGQTRQVIDELAGEDLEEVMEIVGGFMPGSRKTGTEPSPS